MRGSDESGIGDYHRGEFALIEESDFYEIFSDQETARLITGHFMGGAGCTVHAVGWIAMTGISGIVGNVADDAIRAMLERARSFYAERPGKQPKTKEPDDRFSRIHLIAKLALQVRCAELGIDMPTLDDLTVVRTEPDTDLSNVLHIVVDGRGLRGEVVLWPADEYQSSRIPVKIWSALTE
jgi:hypothetical protein